MGSRSTSKPDILGTACRQAVLQSSGLVKHLPSPVDHIHEVAVMQLSCCSSGGIELHIVMEPLGEKVHYAYGVETVHSAIYSTASGTSGQVQSWCSFLKLSRELLRWSP